MASIHKSQFVTEVKYEVDKASLAEVQKSLQSIQNAAIRQTNAGTITPELKAASDAAKELSTILNQSWNTKLNQLDLTKFNTSIKASYGSIEQLRTRMIQGGEVGVNAFNNIARSVLSTNVALQKSNQWLDKMAITMSNTIRFGISSSIFNNFTGSIQKAFGYVQKLDKSLNDIRIVSNASAADMEKFAKYANQAAGAMGASTLDYTNAALIYYQQGLDEQQVKERSDITVKMANVLGTSASEVSDYMTAIWNNFDDGSKSLEYYADVLTSLGAKTASSAEEISTGLEKFAAVSSTVGLSYEYAAAALTTVTDRTRQSAEVVGTAFKTLFARIQGLKLGETLDDGTTLNKYSEALQAVGISIKDQSGNLKDMDDILDEMGAKWGTLSKDQQVALAQTVAGVRQYTQLIALMDNWDFFQQNIQWAAEATGELNNQQEIYMDSLEAHFTQLKTQTEALYDNLLDEDAIKSFTDLLIGALKTINTYIRGLGNGLNPILTLVSHAGTLFSNQIGGMLATRTINKQTQKQNAANFIAQKDWANQNITDNTSASGQGFQEELEYYEKIKEVREQLNEQDLVTANNALTRIGNLKEEIAFTEQWQRIAEEAVKGTDQQVDTIEGINEAIENEIVNYKGINQSILDVKTLMLKYNEAVEDGSYDTADLKKTWEDIWKQWKADGQLTEEQFDSLFKKIQNADQLSDSDFVKLTKQLNINLEKSKDNLYNLRGAAQGYHNVEEGVLATKKDQLKNEQSIILKLHEEKTLAQQYSSIVKGTSIIFSSFSSLKGIFNVLQDDTLSSWQKFSSIVSVISVQIGILVRSWAELKNFIPSVITLFKSITNSIGEHLTKIAASIVASKLYVKNTKDETKAIDAETDALKQQNKELAKNNLQKQLNKLSNGVTKNTGAQVATNTVTSPIMKQLVGQSAPATMGKMTGATVTTGKAVSAASKSTLLLGTTLKGLILTIGGVVLALGALAAAIYIGIKWYNKDADAAKKAAERAKNLKEEYNGVKDSYKQLTSALSSYEEAVKGLTKLQEGTREWKEQVAQINEQVVQLLQTYPELAQYVQNVNGVMMMSVTGVNKLLTDQWAKVQGAYRTSILAEIDALQKQLISEETNFTRKIGYNKKVSTSSNTSLIISRDSQVEHASNSNTYTPRTDSEIEHAKKANNGTTQATQQAYTEQYTYTNMSSAETKKLEEALRKHGVSILKDEQALIKATGFNQELAKELIKNRDAVLELNKNVVNVDKRIELLKTEAVSSYLSVYGGPEYQKLSEEDRQRVTEAVAAQYSDTNITKHRKDEYDSGFLGWSWAGGGKSDKEIHEEYAKLMGYQVDKTKDKTGAAVYTKADGSTIKISDSEVRDSLAREAAMQDATADLQEYIKAINALGTAGKDAAKELNLIGTEFDNTSRLLKTGFQGDFDFSTATDAQLQALRSIREDAAEWKNVEKYWKAAGYSSAEEFTKSFDKQMATWDTPEKTAERMRNLALQTEQQYNATVAVDAEALGVSESALRSYTEHLMKTNEALKEDKLLAEKTAVAAFKFAAGVDKLAEALNSNLDILKDWKNGLTSSANAYKAIGAVQDAIKEMFGFRVSEDYVKEHLEDLEKLANGDVSALEKLEKAASKDYVAHMFINADDTRVTEIRNKLNSYIDDINTKKIEVGAELDDKDFIDSLNEMIDKGETTSDEVQGFLNSIGYEPTFEESTAETPAQEIETVQDIYFDPGKEGGWVGEKHIGTIRSVASTGDLKATMYGISNAESSDKGKITGAKYVGNASGNKSSILNRGGSGRRVGKTGGNSSKPKKVEHKDPEIDRYHQINTQIEKVNKSLEKLQKDQNRLTGQSKFSNLAQQWQLLNNQVNNYNEKIRIAKQEQSELRAKLATQGVQFNADGTIKNYIAAIKKQDEALRALENQYNRLSAAQQEQWDDQKILQNAEDKLAQLQKDLDRYDELTVSEIPENVANALEQELQKLEIRIQELNLEVDVKLKTAEAERDWNAFRKRVIDKIQDDDILGNMRVTAADMATYISNNNSGQLDVDNAHLRYLLDHQNEFAADPVKYQEELDKAYKQVQDDLLAIQDLEEEMHQYNLDMLDEAQDKFDKQIDTYQQLGDMLEHDAKLVQMTLGDKAYEQLGQLFEKQHENNTQQLIFYRTQVDYWKQIRDGYKEGSDEWNNANEKMIEAMNNAESTLETVLQNTAEAFKNSINQMFKTFNDGLTKGFGLDYANEQWDLINKNADTYLDTINQIQGINDLERKYLDAINKNSNPAAQQKLQKIMSEQLTLLREKDRLTKSDLDMAQKRYDLYVAQIALEEAQRNKSTMYLRRDSRGNYRYQYAMDTEAYDKAKNDVDIARNALYNENKARAISDIETIQKTNEEMQKKLQEAMKNNDLDMIALLDEQYTQWLGENRTEFAQHLAELDEAIAEEWLAKTGEDFTTASAERQAEIRRQLIPQLEALSRYSVDGLTSDSLAQLFAQAREMVNANKNTINEDLANGGRTLEELQEGKNQDIEIVTELLDKNQDLLDNYKEQIDATNDFVDAEIARVEALKAERDMVENATEAYEKLTNARNEEGADYAKALGLDTYSDTYGQEGINTNTYEAATSSYKVLNNQTLEDIAKIVYGSAAQEIIDLIKNNNNLTSDILTAGQVLRFASGGYTGDWAGTSRLAALDQKELILNATDTANMLNAVTVMRNLAYSLGETTLARLAGVAANNPGFKTDENGIVQDVYIDAQFPNVTNSREIEEAFNNLVNAASQRIFTNK